MESFKEKDQLADPSVDGRIIFKCISVK